MRARVPLALIACGTLLGCALGPPGEGQSLGGLSLPSLPSISSLLPSSDALPSLSPSNEPRKPERIGTSLYRVVASDRRFDDDVQRENYALLRAAETTKEAGGTHFIVVNGGNHPAGSGSQGLGSAPALGTLIRVLRLERGTEPPIGAVDADEIIHFFGPSFGRTEEQTPRPEPAP
jgi:hypothetical protein